MAKKAENLSYTEIIDNISKKLEKPIFLYEEQLTFEDLYKNIKEDPFNFKSVIYCLCIFFILNGVYFWIIEKYFNFSYYHLLIIPLLFLISILWVIKHYKKIIYKTIAISNVKFYFYDNFLIIISKDTIERIPYNKIILIRETNLGFILSIKSEPFVIKKSKIDDKFYNFLKTLSKTYKDTQISSDDNLFWDCLHKHMSKYDLYCINDRNKQNLDKYYHTKKVYKIIFLYVLCINFLLGLAIFSFTKLDYNPTDYILFMIFIIVLTFFSIPNHIKYIIKEIMKTKQEKLYFYNSFLLIKNEDKIFKCNYDKIKSVIEEENLLFIKVKKLLSPIVVNKQNLSSEEYNLLKKLKTSTIQK